MFYIVVNGQMHPEDEADLFCPEWEIPARLYNIAKKLTRDDLISLALLLTNPDKTALQLKFWIEKPTSIEVTWPNGYKAYSRKETD